VHLFNTKGLSGFRIVIHGYFYQVLINRLANYRHNDVQPNKEHSEVLS